MMKIRKIAAITAALALPAALPAYASTWDFEGSFGALSVSALITESAGLVTGITGTMSSPYGAITSLAPTFFANSNGDHLIADNIFPLNPNGINFNTATGMVFNLWGNGGNSYTIFSGYEGNPNPYGAGVNNVYRTGTGTMTAAVPEPETFAMLLSGLGMMGFIGRRRSIAAANA